MAGQYKSDCITEYGNQFQYQFYFVRFGSATIQTLLTGLFANVADVSAAVEAEATATTAI